MSDDTPKQSDQRPSLSKLALGDMSHEHRVTRTVLERVPDSALDWRPHEKSWTTGELANHIVNLLGMTKVVCETAELDLAASGSRSEPPDTTAELLERWDSLQPAAVEAVKSVSDADMMEDWTLRNGDHVVFTAPRAAAIRSFTISHLIHHRAQLGLYLRLLDESVPSMYGPTADEGA